MDTHNGLTLCHKTAQDLWKIACRKENRVTPFFDLHHRVPFLRCCSSSCIEYHTIVICTLRRLTLQSATFTPLSSDRVEQTRVVKLNHLTFKYTNEKWWRDCGLKHWWPRFFQWIFSNTKGLSSHVAAITHTGAVNHGQQLNPAQKANYPNVSSSIWQHSSRAKENESKTMVTSRERERERRNRRRRKIDFQVGQIPEADHKPQNGSSARIRKGITLKARWCHIYKSRRKPIIVSRIEHEALRVTKP